MKMRLFYSLLFGLLFSQALWAQNSLDEASTKDWYDGELTLSDGSALKGRMKYDLTQTAVRVEVDNTIKAYGVLQVNRLVLISPESSFQEFRRLNIGDGPVLYRIIGENDKVAYLSRYSRFNAISQTAVPTAGNGLPGDNQSSYISRQETVGYEQFIGLTASGEKVIFNQGRSALNSVTSFTPQKPKINRKQVKAFLRKIDPKIDKYIKQYDLRLGNPADLEQIMLKTLRAN